MKLLLAIVLVVLLSTQCFAEIKLFVYTEKDTGDIALISFGEQPIQNPKWSRQVIQEDQKDYYEGLQTQQKAAKQSSFIAEKDRKAKKCVAKLKDLGFDKDEINAILGGAYGN